MRRRGNPDRWRMVVVIVAVGGAVAWSLARARQVVLAPGRTGMGAQGGALGGQAGARTSSRTAASSQDRDRFGSGGSDRMAATAPPAPAFRTADALAGQVDAARFGSPRAEDSAADQGAVSAGADRAAGDPLARQTVEDERIAHPGTVAAGLGEPPVPTGAVDPWGKDAPLGAAGRGPGQPLGEAFGSAAAEELFAPSQDTHLREVPEAALSTRIEELLPEGIQVEEVTGEERGAAEMDAGDALLGLASAQAIGHGVAPLGLEEAEPEPSLAELQDEARDMALGTSASSPAGAATTADRSRRVPGDEGGEGPESGSKPAAPEGFVPDGAVAGNGSHDCPEQYPIKGNASSRIFHEPEGASYGQTIPEFCFATAEDAENAGYRATKR